MNPAVNPEQDPQITPKPVFLAKFPGPEAPKDVPLARFTDRARKILHFAVEEAQKLNHNYIGTEHLLLGMLRETDGVATHALLLACTQHKPTEYIRQVVMGLLGNAEEAWGLGQKPTPPVRITRVWEHAANQRRLELIRKKNQEGLTTGEESEYARLQTQSRQALAEEFPAPSLIDKRQLDLLEENAKLRAIIAKHNLCHDQHGQVGPQEFADGCAAEQFKEFGTAPDRENLQKAVTLLQSVLKAFKDLTHFNPPDLKAISAFLDSLPASVGGKCAVKILTGIEHPMSFMAELETAAHRDQLAPSEVLKLIYHCRTLTYLFDGQEQQRRQYKELLDILFPEGSSNHEERLAGARRLAAAAPSQEPAHG